ncbi:DUF6838 family protein [Companilactobacillus musae]|uniref:phage tail terminator family protein n=1 Tax=Companilactobacillus musae TaxID=1903258 RepID=UPI0034481A02
MKESIVELIGNELAELYPNIQINRENRKGGFEEPSFFVQKVDTGVKPELFDIQNRKYAYQIVYFPKIDRPNEDMESVEEVLADNFTDLKDYATFRNRNFKQSDDNTLQMTFEVWIRAHKVDNTPKQENMKFKGGIANGN